jgi:hypothetical protein
LRGRSRERWPVAAKHCVVGNAVAAWPDPIQCGFAAIEFQQMPDGKG